MAALEQAQVQVGDSWGQLIFEQEAGSVLKKLDEVSDFMNNADSSLALEILSPYTMPASKARKD
jgi:hypothetical protein